MTVLAADRILTPHRIIDSGGWVSLERGLIAEVGPSRPPESATRLTGTLVPGFVDIHCHGGAGAAFESADPEQVTAAARMHLHHGTTTLIASLVSAERSQLEKQLATLVPMCEAGVIAGIHLEGPWLSLRYKGAHDPKALRDPSVAELNRLLDAGAGWIRMITFAPERPGALETIRACVAQGVVAAVGHTDALYRQVADAVDAGVTVATHLFNAMRPVHHRKGGPVTALSEAPQVTVELIADGIHLSPAVLGLARRASSNRVALVTDAMAAAGCGDGRYELGSLAVEVQDGIARIVDGGAIAGSTLTMDAAVRYYTRTAGSGIVQAVTAATNTPARALRLRDAGAIVPGAPADLVLLDDTLTVRQVWRRGEPQLSGD
ncbi:MAG: N-acetylglucosamine-6-phosphate deacetylase [Candidatus Nanopelagicales bacterium]